MLRLKVIVKETPEINHQRQVRKENDDINETTGGKTPKIGRSCE